MDSIKILPLSFYDKHRLFSLIGSNKYYTIFVYTKFFGQDDIAFLAINLSEDKTFDVILKLELPKEKNIKLFIELFEQQERISPREALNVQLEEFVEFYNLSFVDLFEVDVLRDVNQKEKKYCNCVLKTSSKQPEKCLREKRWYEIVDGKKCYNPYAVCASSTKGNSKRCYKIYDFEDLSDEELKAYANLRGLEIDENRDVLLERIYTYIDEEKR
jgi:hypothetical protein